MGGPHIFIKRDDLLGLTEFFSGWNYLGSLIGVLRITKSGCCPGAFFY